MDKGKIIAAVVGIALGIAGSLLGMPNLKSDICNGVIAPSGE
jgi:hypothetical protein